MKKVSNLIMSSVKCSHKDCNRFIKQNVIDRQPHADKCYKHRVKSGTHKPDAFRKY